MIELTPRQQIFIQDDVTTRLHYLAAHLEQIQRRGRGQEEISINKNSHSEYKAQFKRIIVSIAFAKRLVEKRKAYGIAALRAT